MELRQLRHFLAVLETGSLRRASKALHISEPALSKSLNRLEQEFRVPLLDRKPRGMEPTPFGEVLAAHAKLVFSEITLASEELAELRGGARNILRIAVGPSLAAALPGILAPLSSECPGSRVIVHEGLYHATIAAVTHDSADFGLVPVEEDFDEPDLETEFIAEYPLGIVARAGHPLTALASVTPVELAGSTWVVPPRQDRSRLIFQSLCERNHFSPSILAESFSLTFTLSSVSQSDALAFLPHLVAQSSDKQAFGILPAPGFLWTRKLYAVRRKRKTRSLAEEVALREIRKLCAGR